MIPKIIHYCWFGQNEIPESVKKCIESWEKFCPDYEIKEWNEKNYNIKKNKFIEEAYKDRKYAFVSDYVRLDIIYNYGGIYLDTDVELIRNLDDLLNNNCYLGCELEGEVNTGLGFGAKKKNGFLLENMNIYENKLYDPKNLETCVEITTNLLKKYNLNETSKIQKIRNVVIYPPEYFCPYNIKTRKINITPNTYSIHHYDATWYSNNKFLKYINKKTLSLKIKLKIVIDKIFGEGTYRKIKNTIKKSKRNRK